MRPRLPTLRSSLLGIHRAIFQIQIAFSQADADPTLSPLEEMVILLEDRRFFQHSGVDWKAIAREVWKLIRLKRPGGASTIDMQLFRTVSNRYERTLRRKLREISGTLSLQRKFSKLEILRAYLQVAYFGTGLTGVRDASLAMYNKTPDELDLRESARIASMLVYPKPRLTSDKWLAKVTRRTNYGYFLYTTRKKRNK